MTYPDAFRPPVLGLVFTALLKFSPAELDQPPSPLPDDSTGADAGADDAVGLAQSGSPYWPLIVQYIIILRRFATVCFDLCFRGKGKSEREESPNKRSLPLVLQDVSPLFARRAFMTRVISHDSPWCTTTYFLS